MAEKCIAIGTTDLAGGKVITRKNIQNKKLRVLLDPYLNEFLVYLIEDGSDTKDSTSKSKETEKQSVSLLKNAVKKISYFMCYSRYIIENPFL